MQKSPPSAYQDDLPDLEFAPKGGPGHLYDILIMGGGFTGVSAALELADAGLDVALIEAFGIGNGGSGRNGGHVLPDWPSSFHHIEKYLSREEADMAFDIGMATVRLARERMQRYEIDCDLQMGYVHAAYHKRHEAELLDMQETYAKRGLDDLTFLPDEDCVRTHVGTSAYKSALYDKGAGHIQPLKYLHGLARAAASAGADMFQNTLITQIDPIATTCTTADGHLFRGRHLLICGNAYLQGAMPKAMRRTLATVTSSVLATAPLSDNLAHTLFPERDAVADSNAALNYYRLDAQNRLIFGGRASYMIPDNPAIVGRDLQKRMLSVFPELASTAISHIWSGRIGITVSRIPQFGSLSPTCDFVQGFSGHGVALSGMAGKILAQNIMGDHKPFETLSKIGHMPFPGGPLRTPVLALGMAYYKLRDRLKL
ncbi:MAG: NAD(P)/FAD-dependent oxidoreductase [Candidatus Puniceispirillaceae bacterium]